MKHTTILLAVAALVLSAAYACRAQNAQAGRPSQTVVRAGSQPSSKGPAENFTGNVTVTPLFPADAAAPYSGGYVTFEAGARSAWHTHPAGQRLVLTAGVGRTQEWEGQGPGDQGGRRHLLPARRQALARGCPQHRHDASRPHGHRQQQSGRVDGESHRRAIQHGKEL